MPDGKISILLVDDDRIDRMAMERLVTKQGLPYDLTTASCQKEGLEKLASRKFDLVILDYMLGDGTGLEILTQIKGAVPVIFVTGSGDEEIAATAMKMGAYDYLIKDPERNYLTVLPQTVRKVMERKRADDAVRKLSSVVEQTVDAVTITNREGIIEYVNPAFLNLTGFTEDEVVGQTPAILKSGAHPPVFYEEMWQSILAGKAFHAEFNNRRKDGSIYSEGKTITPIRDSQGNITHFVSTGRDITERKRAEMELRMAKEQAEEATKLKDKFVSLVSHDLKSPLSTMMGFIKLIKADYAGTMDGEGQNMLDVILESGQRMNSIIEELLSISMLKTGKILPKLKFFDAYYVAIKTIMAVEYNAKVKGINLVNNVPGKTRIYADPMLFEQVLQNLVSNALKFSHTGGSVTISVPAGRPTTIAVSDTGVGMDKGKIDNIFHYDVQTTTPGTSGEIGTGLGLPLSHDIMLAHNGALTLDSTPGEGTTFYATLPHICPLVLLVEDDPFFVKIAHQLLSPIDIEVMHANNGVEALERLKARTPHLIITDLNMPEMDGFELIRRLKADNKHSEIPVIVFTVAEQEERERVFQLGVNDFVSKTTAKEELIPRVRRIVS